MEMRPGDLLALADMLKPPGQQEDSSDDDLPPPGLARLGPGSIGAKSKGSKDDAPTSRTALRIRAGGESDVAQGVASVAGVGVAPVGGGGGGGRGDEGSIWCPEEVPVVPDEDDADPRPLPQYDMCYRQAVSTEDVYLQMGGRTPATASCEELVVRVQLPGERLEAISVDVTPQRVHVRSPAFRLPLALPHAADPNAPGTRARWDARTHTLTITLRLTREFDFVNF